MTQESVSTKKQSVDSKNACGFMMKLAPVLKEEASAVKKPVDEIDQKSQEQCVTIVLIKEHNLSGVASLEQNESSVNLYQAKKIWVISGHLQ